MFAELLQPFEFNFMNKAFLITIIISFPCSLLSCYLVLKGWSLVGDAISHAILPGIALSYIFGTLLVLGATIAGVFCIVLSGFISDRSRIKNDTSLGIVFSAMFAVGLILVMTLNTNIHLHHIIFGNLLGVETNDIISTLTISVLTFIFLIIRKNDLFLFSFDPLQASIAGINTKLIYYLLLIFISLVVVSNLYTVGIILSIGLLIVPGSIGFLLSKNFFQMQVVALFSSIIAIFFGIYISFYIDSSPAPTIILFQSSIFFFVLILKIILKNFFINLKIIK